MSRRGERGAGAAGMMVSLFEKRRRKEADRRAIFASGLLRNQGGVMIDGVGNVSTRLVLLDKLLSLELRTVCPKRI